MNGVNRVILVGNLGKDPDVRTLESGTKVAKFSMATNERYTNKSGEKVTKTEWHNVIVWRGLAETAERFLKKGSMVYVEGKLRSSTYQDKEGITKYTTEVEAENFTLLNRLEGAHSSTDSQGENSMEAVSEYSANGEDLPF